MKTLFRNPHSAIRNRGFRNPQEGGDPDVLAKAPLRAAESVDVGGRRRALAPAVSMSRPDPLPWSMASALVKLNLYEFI